MRIPYCGQTITVTVEYKYPSRGHIVMKRNPFTPEQIKLVIGFEIDPVLRAPVNYRFPAAPAGHDPFPPYVDV